MGCSRLYSHAWCRCGYLCQELLDRYVLQMWLGIEKALDVFQGMKDKDSVSWTSVISGLAMNGFADSTLDLFSQMLGEGEPTHGTFVGILRACADVGLVNEGLEYFESMETVHGLVPEKKHYRCVVDLLSRSGNIDKVYEFIN